MLDSTTSLERLLDAVAARQPVPGGGAVAALAGALACAIGEMTLNYSVGKRELEAHQAELAQALASLRRARGLFLQFMVEDQGAYEATVAARQDTDDSRRSAALLAAIRVPQSVAATAAAVLEQVRRVAPIASRWLLSDLAVCVELAMCTVRAGVWNVRVNLREVPDPGERQALAAWGQDIVGRSVKLVQEVMPTITRRMES